MKPYIPDELPLKGLNHQLLFPLVGEARAALARYDGLLQGTANASVQLSQLSLMEAEKSSRIEGTQAKVDEVLEHEAGLIKQGEKSKDIREILNYRRAMLNGLAYLEELPIRLFVVRAMHRILMDSTRGEDKNPGEFRRVQNWIGTKRSTIEQASFVPPEPFQLPMRLEEWEKYLLGDDIDPLLQTAVMHAQFELLHPFKDGNGRIGRILIPLFLCKKKLLSLPMFYLSGYLEVHRDEYFEKLGRISAQQDWNGWIAFFLKAVAVQARQNETQVKSIRGLYEEMKKTIREITRSQYALHIQDAIFSTPIFSASALSRILSRKFGIHRATTLLLLRRLKEAGIISVIFAGRGRRSTVFRFSRLIDLAEG